MRMNIKRNVVMNKNIKSISSSLLNVAFDVTFDNLIVSSLKS
jgi:hypothetical protein